MKSIKKFMAVLTIISIVGVAGIVYAETQKPTAGNKTQMLEQKKAVLDQRVKDGKLTQEKADEIYNAIKSNQATCDGTGSAQIGKKYGVGFGMGQGAGKGMGKCQGQ
jgi:hypothetical protein